MTIQFIHDILATRMKELFARYKQFIAIPDQDESQNALCGVIRVANIEDNHIELLVGTRTFIIKGEIFLSKEMFYLKTFELRSFTGRQQDLVFKHLKDLDVVYIYNQSLRFVNKIEVPNNLLNNPTIIRDFNTQYTDHLWKIISEVDEQDAPIIESIG